jgi:amino acid transporter
VIAFGTSIVAPAGSVAGFEAAAALGEEARNTRRSVPASTIWIVVVTGIFYLLVVCAETFAAGRHGIAAFVQ